MTPFVSPFVFFFPPLFSTISPYILPLLLPPLRLPFLHFLCSCLKLRTEQLVIEDHCLSSGPQDLQCLSPRLIFARQFFGPLFVCFFFPSSFFFSHKLHKPFLKLDFHLRWTRSTRRVYAAFLPSIFLSLFFTSFQAVLSSISSCELSPLSPARTGAPFSSWRRFKGEKKRRTLSSRFGWLCKFVGKRRNWEDPDQSDRVPDSLLRKVHDVLTSFKLLHTDKELFLCYVTNMFSITSLFYKMTSLHHIERISDMFSSPLELDDKQACFWTSHEDYNQGRSFYWHVH